MNQPNDRPHIPVYSDKVPTPDDFPVVPRSILLAATKIAVRLAQNVQEKWALGGDASELMQGVNVKDPDHLEIVTTPRGCDEICENLAEYVTLKPAMAEKQLERKADIAGQMLPVYIKSHYAELVVDGVKVEIYGDEQIKVGEWEWGDPLDFTSAFTNVSGGKVPLVPLSLDSELAFGLGWLDRVALISDAVVAKHHTHLK